MADTAQTSASDRPGDPCAVVIFGATGDLTKRKLLPALMNLKSYGLLPREFAIVGVARRKLSTEQVRESLRTAVTALAPGWGRPAWGELESAIDDVGGVCDRPETFAKLKARLAETEARHHTSGNVMF